MLFKNKHLYNAICECKCAKTAQEYNSFKLQRLSLKPCSPAQVKINGHIYCV